MKAVVVYYSQFGNTRQVAEAIARIFREEGEARTLSAEQIASGDLQEVDLVVMGARSHSERPHVLVGSVANKVFHHSPVPVLFYRSAPPLSKGGKLPHILRPPP